MQKMEQIELKKKERYSGVELLRIVAIFLICISHAVQTSNEFVQFETTFSFVNLVLRIFRYFGMMGNILFAICSAWFLVDSKKTKWNKVFVILFDSMVISIFVMLCYVCAGYPLSKTTIIKQIFPDIFKNVWFVPAYVIFYILHPVFSFVVEKLNQWWHLILVILLVIVLGVITELCNLVYNSSAIQFVYVYFVVAYFKKYHMEFCDNKKLNIIGFLLMSIMFLLIAASKYVMYFVGGGVDNNAIVNSMVSPMMFPALFCLFNLFRQLKIKSGTINYLASCSLFVYCLHENILIRRIARPWFYERVLAINSSAYFGWIMLQALVLFVGAYLIAVLYKFSVHKATTWLANKAGTCVNLLEQNIKYAYAELKRK